MNGLFVIVHQKAELKPQAATAKPRHDEEESLAKISVIYALTNIAVVAANIQTREEDVEVLISEISSIIFSIIDRY